MKSGKISFVQWIPLYNSSKILHRARWYHFMNEILWHFRFRWFRTNFLYCSMAQICRFVYSPTCKMIHSSMGLLQDTQNCGLRMWRECREHFPRHRRQRKPRVSDPDMHHCTCVTHVPWRMSGSLIRGAGEMFSVFPAHAQPTISRLWQEAHVRRTKSTIGYTLNSINRRI